MSRSAEVLASPGEATVRARAYARQPQHRATAARLLVNCEKSAPPLECAIQTQCLLCSKDTLWVPDPCCWMHGRPPRATISRHHASTPLALRNAARHSGQRARADRPSWAARRADTDETTAARPRRLRAPRPRIAAARDRPGPRSACGCSTSVFPPGGAFETPGQQRTRRARLARRARVRSSA